MNSKTVQAMAYKPNCCLSRNDGFIFRDALPEAGLPGKGGGVYCPHCFQVHVYLINAASYEGPLLILTSGPFFLIDSVPMSVAMNRDVILFSSSSPYNKLMMTASVK